MSAPGQRQSPFPIVMRGYDRDQVTDHIRRLEADIAMMSADRDSAHAHADELLGHLDKARDQISRLQQDVESLSIPPTTVTGMSERVSRMLHLATEEAGEMRSAARDEADEVISVAKQEAECVVADAHLEAERTGQLAQDHADKIVTEAQARAKAVEEAAAEAKAAADKLLADARDEAQRVMAAAQADAAQLRGSAHNIATARLARSRELAQSAHDAHKQVLDHLAALREHLGALPGALALSDDELDLVATTGTDDLELLNRTLIGRDRFTSDDLGRRERPTVVRDETSEKRTDVLEIVEAVEDDFDEDGFDEPFYRERRHGGNATPASA
ncbi:MAG: hypothetical protein QM658_07795 [Gordonia sp. (in: high G+C Gram-positive bacteria)]